MKKCSVCKDEIEDHEYYFVNKYDEVLCEDCGRAYIKVYSDDEN